MNIGGVFGKNADRPITDSDKALAIRVELGSIYRMIEGEEE